MIVSDSDLESAMKDTMEHNKEFTHSFFEVRFMGGGWGHLNSDPGREKMASGYGKVSLKR